MELRQLRYFLAVADELHFRRAAARLHMSQPPLSQQIQLLEAELGCRLFNRTRRHVELTPAGRAFQRDVDAMLRSLDDAVTTVRRIHAGETGRLRVDYVGSALLSLVPGLVQRFRTERPDVEVVLRMRATEGQVRAVREGTIDVGFAPLPIDDASDLCTEVLLREHTVAALPANHRLARLKRVPLAELAAEPLVLFPRSQAPGLHDHLLASLSAGGRAPFVEQYAPEMQTIVGLIAAGMGVSIVQASVQRLALDGVTYRPIAGGPVVELAALMQPDQDSPLVEGLLELARRDPVAAVA